MSEFEDKLNAILSNPEAMAQVMGLAQSLNGSGAFGELQKNEKTQAEEPPAGGNTAGGIGDLGDLFSRIDPKMIERMLPLIGELSGGEKDERMQLLYALRPFLKPERRDKVERAVQAAKMIRIGKKLLSSMGDPNV